jgi:riboflavin kinase/FMN adenylyltransferase
MFTAKGIVVEGKRRGAEIGFPTANIAFHDPKFAGIFAARVELDRVTYPTAVYIDPTRGILEAHLLHFQGDLYGKELTIEVFAKIRDSADFPNDADLRAAIAGDIKAVEDFYTITH